jgi:hypothetical protein
VEVTFGSGSQEANVRKRVGYFDENDGLFLEILENNINLVVRSSVSGAPSETRIPQASWNKDRLDGTGNSGITIDFSKTQLFFIDFQWLGVGRVRFGFADEGRDVYCHEIDNANINDSVYMRTAQLPIRYEIENLGPTAQDSLFEQICSSVVREGAPEEPGYISSVDTGFTGSTATTTPRSLISLRLRQDYNRAVMKASELFFYNGGTGLVRYRLVLNPTLAGALSWTDAGQIFQKSLTQQAYTEGSGTTLVIDYVHSSVGSQGYKENHLLHVLDCCVTPIVSNIAGESDIVSLIVDSESGTQDVASVIHVSQFY